MSQKDKIEKILSSVKLQVEDISEFEKDIDSILGMFNQIKEADIPSSNESIQKKKVSLKNLREDTAKDGNFRKDMRGNYFIVPNVSKK